MHATFSDHDRDMLWDLQSDVLAMIGDGKPVALVADVICRRAQSATSGAICSVLTVDREGRLHPLAAPDLPEHYSRAIDSVPIGPVAGSCGTAAYRGEPVAVTDIENDPLWENYRALALPLGLKACWSSPIKARDGRVIGTFAFYFDTCRGPDDFEREVVARCTQLCAIAMEHQDIRKRLHELAFVDLLSGLANRASFMLRIQQLCEGEAPFALLILDLDHLKSTNDTLGHAAGDALIRAVSARLRLNDLACEPFRLGGDEFAMILPGCASEADMTAAAEALIAAVNRPVPYQGHALSAFVTIGGVLRTKTERDSSIVCQNADFALYHGKAGKRGSFVPFREGMRTAISHRMKVVSEVDQALGENRVLAHYQPIVRIDTGEIIGLEALARLQNRDGTVASAGSFHEAFSDARIAYALTGRMLRQVAADMRGWLDAGIAFRHVGFNVTTADFQHDDLESRITQAFAAESVPLEHIILEVNEAVFMGSSGDNRVARAVERLRAKGLRVALDDFGTGYASLTHLLEFPVDIIKIDKCFIDRLCGSRQNSVIVEALIEIARKLDMRLVAEGIESREQAERLVALGCRLGQGYHFARPAASAETTELLRLFGQRMPGSSATGPAASLPARVAHT